MPVPSHITRGEQPIHRQLFASPRPGTFFFSLFFFHFFFFFPTFPFFSVILAFILTAGKKFSRSS